MPFLFFFFLISLPVLEVASIVEVSRWVGPLATFLLLAAALTLGLFLVRSQSLAVGRRVMEAVRAGRPPERPLLEGATVMFAGILLMIPGFISDVLAVILLVPALREYLWRLTSAGVRGRSWRWTAANKGETWSRGRSSMEDVIDVEYTEVPPDEPASTGGRPQKASPWKKAR